MVVCEPCPGASRLGIMPTVGSCPQRRGATAHPPSNPASRVPALCPTCSEAMPGSFLGPGGTVPPSQAGKDPPTSSSFAWASPQPHPHTQGRGLSHSEVSPWSTNSADRAPSLLLLRLCLWSGHRAGQPSSWLPDSVAQQRPKFHVPSVPPPHARARGKMTQQDVSGSWRGV